MEISSVIMEKTNLRKKYDEDLRLCLTFLVCPNCGGDLETATFPSFKYTCKECTFTFTGEQESALIFREQRLLESYGNGRRM